MKLARTVLALAGAVLLMLSAVVPADAAPLPWELDQAHSTVGFTVRHLGVSKVRGSFGVFAAKAVAEGDSGKLVSVEATVDVGSVDTGMEKRDAHLKAPEFFDAAKFPQMKFVSKEVRFDGKDVALVGDLTIKGVTRSVTFKGEHLGLQKANFGAGDNLRTGYSLSTRINRKDFGLSFAAIMEGVSVVSDEVAIELEIELSRSLK